ncbi:MAG: hypothetical protein A3F31_05435 [Candidatus Levybacteria bacterium RIFCSPHIGHO2_12_FULL_38_12]|nr:MAG: hypothetical protein A2770_02495 [Candidatus Levybacteria bacterium RIFCSPHIGHO2_01_FULL_38_12]OGH22459.1 MAG: hypothetical protein A3F31_05435 [Candidatus Levybacteria bacterium RIFCSPHIGHO2_12_FULL_38_12]OGH44370.1 MAG: hypothetical protein A3J14_02200 [Candidatus Levybacteria bacterium RIFCSPLOWO2_02_FULL_37_18]OGH52490.1 MAG: hypothetical protein A3G13_02100 [Candidatus Levybacteria bacterium RIFCSPLOWO2_12_FULL_37_7]
MNKNSGQALMTLVVYVGVAILIISAAVIMILVNSIATNKFEQGSDAYYIAEDGIENALQQLLRNPSYSGETVMIDMSSAQVSVSGINPKTITSIGKTGNFQRRIDVTVASSSGVLNVLTWKEIY